MIRMKVYIIVTILDLDTRELHVCAELLTISSC